VTESSTEELILHVLREGSWSLFSTETNKWKPSFFLITDTTLYWQKKESSTTLSGELIYKDANVEKVPGPTSKYSFGLKITANDKTITIATKNEVTQQTWYKDLTEGVPAVVNQSAKKGKNLRVQKRVGGAVATSAAGKRIIKEAVGVEGYKGVKIIKQLVTILYGKKKSNEVEELIIKISVKVVVLVRNKVLTRDDLNLCKNDIKSSCDLLAHYASFPFEYSVENLKNRLQTVCDGLFVILQYHLTDKNKDKLKELISFLLSEQMLDTLYKNPDLKDLRKDLTYLMKNTSNRLESL